MGFITLLCLMYNDLEHADQPTQTIEVEGLQIKMHLRLSSKVDRLTKTTLIIYFHETGVVKDTEFSNQNS